MESQLQLAKNGLTFTYHLSSVGIPTSRYARNIAFWGTHLERLAFSDNLALRNRAQLWRNSGHFGGLWHLGFGDGQEACARVARARLQGRDRRHRRAVSLAWNCEATREQRHARSVGDPGADRTPSRSNHRTSDILVIHAIERPSAN
jgi:hypothetical protein